jgi:predicted alpha/beta-hydrolase family hydrolase
VTIEIETPHGAARAHLHRVEQPIGAVVLGHGAGGGVATRDLEAATGAALEAGCCVALVEQPYLVAGRGSQPQAAQLDAAWTAVLAYLRGGEFEGLPVAVGVLCLAFPVHPPGKPESSRLAELDAVSVPVLVVQGESDPFGMPPDAAGRTVVRVPGNHSLRGDLGALRGAVREWLGLLFGS